MDEDGERKGEHEKLDEYLLEGYRVIDIITNILPKGGAATGTASLSVTVFLMKEGPALMYRRSK
jgi:hypothetical protein